LGLSIALLDGPSPGVKRRLGQPMLPAKGTDALAAALPLPKQPPPEVFFAAILIAPPCHGPALADALSGSQRTMHHKMYSAGREDATDQRSRATWATSRQGQAWTGSGKLATWESTMVHDRDDGGPTRPWWVEVGLWGLPSRVSAWVFVWLSLALAAASVVGAFWIPIVGFGGGLVFAALWYWFAIRWADNNGSWT
jgi:hypothetical protein